MKVTITLLALLLTLSSYSQEYPKSSPNGGRLGGGDWTINDYIVNAKEDSLSALKSYNRNLALYEYLKPKEKPVENPKKRFKKQNDELKLQQEKYDLKIQEITNEFNEKISRIQKYRNDWVTYLKAKAIATEKAKKERELEAEKKRIEDEKNAEIAKIKAEEERKIRIEEYKAMPTNPEYKAWVAKYEKAISIAQENIDKCEAIIKKHTYKNAFGEKLYDSSDFTESEKKVFNQNLDLLGQQNEKIRELENEKKFYHYWNENVSIERSTSSYRLSSYHNSKNKAY